MADSNPDNDDHGGSQSPSDSVQPQMTMHPIGYSGMPMTMYPFPPGMVNQQPPRTKRRQVKNACTNCQAACKFCDNNRSCRRCMEYEIQDTCVNSSWKKRKRPGSNCFGEVPVGMERTNSDHYTVTLPLGTCGVSIGSARECIWACRRIFTTSIGLTTQIASVVPAPRPAT